MGVNMNMNSSNAKILIVDDEQGTRDFLIRVVKGEGFKTLDASNREICLKMIKFESPDAMLLDIKMQRINRMEVLW
jgi:DNA-binding NtrC family response regulator